MWGRGFVNGQMAYEFDGRAGSGGGLTVKEQDGAPSYADTTTLEVQQDDGLTLTQPGANTALLSLADATATQAGKVNTGAQTFGGSKQIDDVDVLLTLNDTASPAASAALFLSHDNATGTGGVEHGAGGVLTIDTNDGTDEVQIVLYPAVQMTVWTNTAGGIQFFVGDEGVMVGDDGSGPNWPTGGGPTVSLQAGSDPTGVVSTAAGIYAKASGGTTKLFGFHGDGTTFEVGAAGGGGSGTVTSVALTAPSILTVSGSPVTTSGTLALDLATQAANLVFAGPASGAAAAPTFRGLTADDLPDITTAEIAAATLVTAADTIAANDNDTTIPTSAAVKAYADSVGGGYPGLVQGRLTSSTGQPIPSSESTPSVIYFTPYHGCRVALYTGSGWVIRQFAERSLALSGLTANANYDVFLYDDAGTPTLELSAAWASNTTRTDALALQDGVQVKSGAPTRLWLGTIRTTASNLTADTSTRRFIWNHYNQISRRLFRCPGYNNNNAGSTYTYNSTSWIEANGGTDARVEFVLGEAGLHYSIRSCGYLQPPTSGYAAIGLGEDSVTTALVAAYTPLSTAAPVVAPYDGWTGLGYHYLAQLVVGVTAGTHTVYIDDPRRGGSTDPFLTYLSGSILA